VAFACAFVTGWRRNLYVVRANCCVSTPYCCVYLRHQRHDNLRVSVQVRYVIDFYNAAPLPDMPVAMHLDARPALDSFGALMDRLRLQAQFISSGNWRRG